MPVKYLLMSLLLFINLLHADKINVPNKLFGIQLGKHYEIGNGIDSNGNMPIKKFNGIEKFLGEGIHYYFQPIKEYKAFKYFEKKKTTKSNFHSSSFSLYLFPVIPKDVNSIDKLESSVKYWEVAGIRWSDIGSEKENIGREERKQNNYNWAKELCKTFQLDIKQEAKILDYNEETILYEWYQCKFTYDGRTFKIDGSHNKSISLDYDKAKFNEKHKEIRDKIRQINLNEIRPY